MDRYTDLWTGRWLANGAKTIDDLIRRLESEAGWLREALAAGVRIDTEIDYGREMLPLVTGDPEVAEVFGFLKDEWD